MIILFDKEWLGNEQSLNSLELKDVTSLVALNNGTQYDDIFHKTVINLGDDLDLLEEGEKEEGVLVDNINDFVNFEKTRKLVYDFVLKRVFSASDAERDVWAIMAYQAKQAVDNKDTMAKEFLINTLPEDQKIVLSSMGVNVTDFISQSILQKSSNYHAKVALITKTYNETKAINTFDMLKYYKERAVNLVK